MATVDIYNMAKYSEVDHNINTPNSYKKSHIDRKIVQSYAYMIVNGIGGPVDEAYGLMLHDHLDRVDQMGKYSI